MGKRNIHSVNISRKTRAVLNFSVSALILLLLSFCWIKDFKENYVAPISVEEQFRMEEEIHMVGPGKILADLSLDAFTVNEGHDRLILASTDKGVETFLYDSTGQRQCIFNYREKQGDITVLSVPSIFSESWAWSYIAPKTRLRIPVILFDSHPQAVRAEVDIELSAIFDPAGGHIYRNTYHMAADRSADGYFLLELSVRDFGYLREEGRAVWYLTDFSKGCEVPQVAYYEYLPIHVRLYDQNGNIVCTEYIELRTTGGDARLERGDDSW